MAEVRPLRALRYNPAAVSLDDATAPPYDVIDAARRAELAVRSPFNVVEIDLPEPPAGADPYEHAAETMEEWILQGILVSEREPSMWALEQDYVGPDGRERTRRGIVSRVRVAEYGPGRIRPHERTQPGAKEDRLRLTRATRHNLSPIFALHRGDAWRQVEPATSGPPWAEARDRDGTVHRVWRVADPAGLDGVGVFGYVEAGSGRGWRLRLRDPDALERLLPHRSPAYRRLDAAILERLVLEELLGLTTDDIAAK